MPDILRRRCRQFEQDFFQSCCSQKHIKAGGFLLEMCSSGRKCKVGGAGEWLDFLYNTLGMARERKAACRSAQRTNSKAEQQQMLWNICWHVIRGLGRKFSQSFCCHSLEKLYRGLIQQDLAFGWLWSIGEHLSHLNFWCECPQTT